MTIKTIGPALEKTIGQVVEVLVNTNARVATKFLEPKFIVRATRTTYRKNYKNAKFNNGSLDITLTLGRPNYHEREFIKKCLIVKEPFPVKKIQLKFLKSHVSK